MEQDGLEWSCPTCTKKKQLEEKEKIEKVLSKQKGSVQTKLNFTASTPTSGRKCIMCKGPVRENSVYCGDDCIRKHSQRAISQLNAATKVTGNLFYFL